METLNKKEQLYRRITKTTMCYKENDEYKRITLPGAKKREDFHQDQNGFIIAEKLPNDCPFV